ncbi:hypothetical protein EG328_008637 [Venturia inaequalis]|uniref:Uncharacterized protein n=1 Tax=Venturia inaequalis TaxID=5025 RepID=A0A8H3UAV9_VENIN|nr:hypothetical protein EG328_008637 [Venturia inaequalis]
MFNLSRVFPNGFSPDYCASQIKSNISVIFWDNRPKVAVRCDFDDASSQVTNYRASIVTEHDHDSVKKYHVDKIRMLESETSGRYSVVMCETGPCDSIDEAMQTLLLVTMKMVDDKFGSGHQPGEPAEY